MAAQTIREFLVAVKYAQDQESLKKFRTTLASISKEIAAVGAGGAAGLAGFILALNKTADAMARVYYEAKNLGTSSSELMKLKYAGDQVGGLGDTLVSMAQALKSVARDTSGASQGVWRLLGAKPEDLKDVSKSLYDIVAQYHAIIAAGGSEVAERALLKSAGIDPDAIRQAAVNFAEFKKSYGEFAELVRNAGFDNLDQAMQTAADYQREWNKLSTEFSLVWEKLATDLMPTFQHIFEDVVQAFKEHEEDIKGFFNSIEASLKELNKPENWKGVIDSIHTVANALAGVAHFFEDINKYADEFNATLKPISDGLDKLNKWGQDIGQGVRNIFRHSLNEPPTMQAPGTDKALHDWVSGKTHSPNVEISPTKGVGQRLNDWLLGIAGYIPFVRLQKDDTTDQQAIVSDVLKAQKELTTRPGEPVPTTEAPTDEAKLKSITNSVSYWMGKGFTKAQAEGITARLAKESGGNWLNPNAINPQSGAYGIAQWLGSRRPAAVATGGDEQKQLDLVNQELNTTERVALAAIRAAKTPAEAALAMEQFERAGNPQFTLSAARYADTIDKMVRTHGPALNTLTNGNAHSALTMMNMTNTTIPGLQPAPGSGGGNTVSVGGSTINVFGYGPEVGSYVFGTQSQLNADMVRNLQTVIQ